MLCKDIGCTASATRRGDSSKRKWNLPTRPSEDEIRSARETIHIAEFIWMGKGDPSERLGRAILARRRGVACRILIDWFGSLRFDPSLEARLEADGVEIRRHAVWPDPFRVSHRRIFAFDGRTAYVGGFGVWKSWLGDGATNPCE